MKVLVTGARGFVGRHLAVALRTAGHEVVAPSGDLALGVDVEGEVEAVVHAAARLQGATPDELVRANVDATRNVAEWARTHGVRTFVYLSSISVYGAQSTPVLDEGSKVALPDPYGLSKLRGEEVLSDASPPFASIALRLPGVLGAGAHRPWLARVAQALLAGEAITIHSPDAPFTSMVHTSELADFVVRLVAGGWTGFERAVLGCVEPRTVRETVEGLRSRLGSRSPIRVGDANAPTVGVDVSHATALGFVPKRADQVLDAFARDLSPSASV